MQSLLTPANLKILLGCLIALLPSLIVAFTKYPRVDGFLKLLLTFADNFAFTVHADSPGAKLKLPLFMRSKPPVDLVPVPSSPSRSSSSAGFRGFVRVDYVQLLLGLAVLGIALTSCAAVTWNSPVFYAGPAVAPIEEVTLKNSSAAAAGGFQATVGLGQFEAMDHAWDALDLSVLALGGVVLPGSGPVGALQTGLEVGTLNGIIGLGVLVTPYTANGEGFLQGGGPGLAFAGMLNVAAITAWLAPASESEKMKLKPRVPRGGLGGQ